MSNKRTARLSSDGLWIAFALLLCASVVIWLAAGLLAAISELDERCSHGLVGPGGPFTVERSSLPPDVRCVFADGTTISTAGALVWVMWACVAATAACAVAATALEFVRPDHEKAARRMGATAVGAGFALALVHAGGTALTSPGKEPLQACSAFVTGIYDRAARVDRDIFPAQATCVYRDGTTYRLLPEWLGVLEWLLLGAVIVCVAVMAAARRRQRAD
jgi:hypothetical protein